MDPRSLTNQPQVYEIIVRGNLDAQRRRWFEGMTLEPFPGGCTKICGPVEDQPALHGLLNRIRDLGLPIVSVTCISSGSSNDQ